MKHPFDQKAEQRLSARTLLRSRILGEVTGTQPIEDIAASSTKKTAKGAAAGAAIGAIADGGDGAAKGAAIGAGASAVKKGESAGNAAGALMEFKLAAPLTVTVKP